MESTDASELLKTLPISNSLSSKIFTNATELFAQCKSKQPDWETRKSKSTLQSCIYLSSISGQEPFSFSSIFDDSSQIHSFMLSLKETMKTIEIDNTTAATARKLIKSYAIGLMNYKKIEELFDKFALQGQYEHSMQMFQSIWLFFIYLRKVKYNNSEDLSECGCLIISVLSLFISSLPNGLTHCIQHPPLVYLADCFKTTASHLIPYVEKVKASASELLLHLEMGNNLQNSLNLDNISAFNAKLSDLYAAYLIPIDLDERYIRNVVSNNELLLTPVPNRAVTGTAIKGKVLNWDEGPEMNMDSQLKDFEQPKSTVVVNQTPITSAIECNSWVSKVLEEYSETSFAVLCGDAAQEIVQKATALKLVAFSRFNSGRTVLSITKCEDILKLYFIALENLLKIEKNKGASTSAILINDKFHRALYACCCETMLYILKIDNFSYEEVLNVLEVSAFDFWKNISSFIQFNIRMPLQIKKHFRDIEERILTKDGWEESSPVTQAIRRMTTEAFNGELSHPSFGQFFKRVLAYSANRITEICGFLQVPQSIQEEIWSAFKYYLSEKTENLIGRHIDVAILCTIYGVNKNKRPSEVSFKSLMDAHCSLFQLNRDLFEKVKMTDGNSGNLIRFYNEIFIDLMKDYLVNKINISAPRILGLSPMSPLKANSFQVPHSPFMTPRTKQLWAFGENTSSGLQGINSMISITSRKINFDMPSKRPRTDDASQ